MPEYREDRFRQDLIDLCEELYELSKMETVSIDRCVEEGTRRLARLGERYNRTGDRSTHSISDIAPNVVKNVIELNSGADIPAEVI